MANVSSSNTTTLYSTSQETIIQPGAAVTTGQVNDANWTTLYTSGQQVTPNANLVVDGTLTVNGCAILTNCTTFSLLPTNATSINFGLEATALSIGSGSGTTLINNQLATANYTFPVADGLVGQVLITDGAGTLSFAVASSVGKDYDISASVTTGGANFNLNSNLPTTDTIKFANGSNVTVVATDANTITISSTDTNTTYDFNASSTTGGVNLNLVGSDSTTDTVKLANGTGVTVSYVSGTEASIAIGQDVATTATPTFGTTTLNGSLKLNGSSSGYSQFTAAATGSNLSYVLPSAQGAASTVLTNDGAGNLTWALPGGGGSTFGNITIGVVTDNTISTTTGDLFITSNNGLAGTIDIDGNVFATTTTVTPHTFIKNSALTNNTVGVIAIQAESTGTPAVGFGPSLLANVELANGDIQTAGWIQWRATDMTVNAENFQIEISAIKNGLVPDNKIVIDSDGNISADGNLTLNVDQTVATSYLYAYSGATLGNISWDGTRWTASNNLTTNGALRINGSSSGYSEFSAAATGANISYVLPSAQGAASTVLTNDGSGNLTWALPGGGGSTFGNVSIGVVTDNTISTTTGDLDITSNTGVINLDNYTAFTDNRLTTTSTSTVTLDSLAIATYQSASYTVTIKNNVTGATQFTKIDLLHDGSVAYIDQYSNMASVADLATFSATISGANAVLQITPASANSTQFTFNRIATKV